MDIPTIINTILAILSFFLAFTSIIFFVMTIKQNNKMIEESTRQYFGIYGDGTYIKNPNFYLIIKNFGQSSATIQSFNSSMDLSKCSFNNQGEYAFSSIINTTLMPGQSLHTYIDYETALSLSDHICFNIGYTSKTHKYEETIYLNLKVILGNFVTHSENPNQELKIISETLQDAYIHSL